MDIKIEQCLNCKSNALHTMGENTPIGVLFAATKDKDGTYIPDDKNVLPIAPVICTNCNHVMLFKAN